MAHILQKTFWNEFPSTKKLMWIVIGISLKFDPKSQINNE